MRWRLTALVLAMAAARPALAGDLTDWSLTPIAFEGSGWTASLGGLAGGTAYAASGLGPSETAGASLSVLLFPHLERTLDNGWEIGMRGAVLTYHDRLAGDIYGDRAFEKAYLFAQTQYGRLELGQSDGAAYRLSVTGPSVDDAIAIDSASTTFFRDPSTGRALIDMFRLQTAVFASANDAKFTYISPQWFGIQLGGSYTPYDSHGGLPFVSRGHGGARNILEGAANYSGYAGSLSYGFYAGLALAHDDSRMPGHGDLVDWGFGGEADTTLEDVKFALGGAFRRSNAYAFDVADPRASANSRAWRLSTTATKGPWIAGFEYAAGKADDAAARPAFDERGFEASLGYVVNSNLQLTAGWQTLRFRRDRGAFFNGGSSIDVDAEFLHLKFHV